MVETYGGLKSKSSGATAAKIADAALRPTPSTFQPGGMGAPAPATPINAKEALDAKVLAIMQAKRGAS